tara:strand:- start:648 stop:1154 length:507 start_codon:yes stop_codon:yes gene_type:complete
MPKIKQRSNDELNLLKEYLQYDSENGLISLKKFKQGREPGTILGSLDSAQGYLYFSVNQSRYAAHRVAWFLYSNEWPYLEIDHINGIKTDNRIKNLRLATRSMNTQNYPGHRNGNPVGVTFRKDGRWHAQAPRNFLNRKATKNKSLGSYTTKEEAQQVVIDYCEKNYE